MPTRRTTRATIKADASASPAPKHGTRIIRLDLPQPPSVNSVWKRSRRGVYLDPRVSAFRLAARTAYLREFGTKIAFPQGDVTVCIQWFRARKIGDTDNIAKSTLDGLRKLAFTDDKQVAELHMRRFDDALIKGRVTVEIMGA